MESLFDFQLFGTGEGLSSFSVTLTHSSTNVFTERRWIKNKTNYNLLIYPLQYPIKSNGAEGGDVKGFDYSGI